MKDPWSIDANKADGRGRARSEEMRRVISLLDLDSFLSGPSLPFTSLAPLSRFTERRRRARNIYTGARSRYLESWRLFVYRYPFRAGSPSGVRARFHALTYVDSHERKRQFVSATPPLFHVYRRAGPGRPWPPWPTPLENLTRLTRGRITDGSSDPRPGTRLLSHAAMTGGRDYSYRCSEMYVYTKCRNRPEGDGDPAGDPQSYT